MSARTWLYGRLALEEVAQHVGGVENPRIFAKKTMTSGVEEHPFIVFKLGNNTNESLSEDSDLSRQFVQIFIHDHTDGVHADYMRIDTIAAAIKNVLKLAGSGDDGVFTALYLETSQDLDDDTLETVMKYMRFQIIQEG